MVRGTGIPETIAIDEITAHDGTVTAIIEEEMKGGNETIDETGLGEMATAIVTLGTRSAEGVLRMLTSDDIVLPSLPVFHPIVHHVCEGHPTPIGKRASEYHLSLAYPVLIRIHTGYLLLCAAHPHHLGKCLVY